MDEINQQTQVAAVTQTDPAAPSQTNADDRLFSQRDLDRIVAHERRTYQQKLQEAQAQLEALPKAPKGKADEPTLDQLRQELQSERNARRFAEATAGRTLNKDQRAVLRKLFEVESPEDPDTWAESMISSLGIGAAPPPTQAAQPQATPAAMPAATSVVNLEHYEVHPKDLTKEMIARIGPQGVRKYVLEWQKRQR